MGASMQRDKIILLPLVAIALTALAPEARAQADRLKRLERRVDALERHIREDGDSRDQAMTYVFPGLEILAVGLFCALWARSTGRDFWLWLMAGIVFNIFALLAVWIKHEEDKKAERSAARKPAQAAGDLE
jgi:hypothetical protein